MADTNQSSNPASRPDGSSKSERDLIRAAMRDAGTLGSRGRRGPAPDAIPGYEILRELHRGGQGVVYEAVQLTTRRRVAIKVLREGAFAGPREKARFEREVDILSRINHPNIVVIHDTGEVNGLHYHVMDFIEGEPLDAYVAGGDWSLNELLRLFAQICAAVSAAHMRGVIHRDLKPANILIDEDGQPHVLDFGLARQVDDEGSADRMTMTGQFLGSLPWASPEQAEGVPDKIDVRTDVYSLGVILYQMLTGRFPYEVAGNMRNALDNILRAEPTRPSIINRQVNDEIETIVLKCLSKERERRYQSAGELARDVGHYLKGEPIEAKRDSALYVLRKTIARHRVKATVATAFAVLIVASSFALAVLYVNALEQQMIAERERDRAEAALRKSQVTTDVLSSILDVPDVIRISADPIAVLNQAARRVDVEFGDMPEVEADLRYALSIGYLLAQPADAVSAIPRSLEEAEQALNLRRAVFGQNHPLTVLSMVQTAYINGLLHHFDEADSLMTSAEEIARGRETIDGEELMVVLSLRVMVLRESGRFEDAVAVQREVLDLTERMLDPGDVKQHVARRQLAYFLSQSGRYDEAIALAQQWRDRYGLNESDSEDGDENWRRQLQVYELFYWANMGAGHVEQARIWELKHLDLAYRMRSQLIEQHRVK